MMYSKQLLVLTQRLALSSILFFGSNLSALAEKLVVLDISKIYNNYSLVKEANQVVSTYEGDLKKMLDAADAKVAELEKKATPAEALEAKKEELQDEIDEKVEDLQDQKELYNTSINRTIAKTLDTYAKEKSIDLVLDKGFVMVPVEDITEDFLVKLEANTQSPPKTQTIEAEPVGSETKSDTKPNKS
jgi:Skp family chaperone for outer membrane proteins